MNFFVNKVFSYYSLLKSTISIDQLIQKTKEIGCPYVLLVDNNMSSCVEFYFKAKDAALTPIIGLEIDYLDNTYILIAKNNIGYHNLLKISSFDRTNVEYQLNDYLDDVIVILKKGDKKINVANFFLATELAINEVHYLNKEDKQTYQALCAISEDKLFDEITLINDNHFLDYEQACTFFGKDLINKTNKILSECHFSIEDNVVKLAQFPLPPNTTSKSMLEQLCLKGLKQKLNIKDSLIDKKYADRLVYELDVINRMNFNDYFLIVQDFVNYAKLQNILIGPGRGSAAGSLVSYALNITEIDPIQNNLLFERFLNPQRQSLPDIDIDVMDNRRQEVIDYIFEKYGINHTSYIATFQRIKAKMAIRDVGRCLQIDLKVIDKISKLIPLEYDNDLLLAVEKSEDLKSFYRLHEKLFIIANSLINIPRQFSTHAAGIIISNDDIYNDMAIQSGIDNWHLSQISMEYVEKIGLIKIDILGLKNLSIISTILQMIHENYGQEIDLNKIDYHDQKIFDEITQANTIGIFQLESPGMRSTLKKVRVNNVEDISIVSALFRPGPQAMINDYVKTKNKQIEPKYINEQIKWILEPTLGFCIYQEQVIELIKSVTGFSIAEADIFRRAISKKKEALFAQMQSSFLEAAIKQGYSREQAMSIYDFLMEFANYGFNHSHSLAYAYISYQMMFLKYYYPLEFYLTLLIHGSLAVDKNTIYISEAKKYGIKFFNVSIINSDINFKGFNNGIMFGFSNIKGIGYEIAKKIISIRNEINPQNYLDVIVALSNSGINKKTLEMLIKVGAFDEYHVDRLFLLENINEIIENGSFKTEDNKFIFGLDLKQSGSCMSEQQKAQYEFEFLNYSFSNNKWSEYFDHYQTEFNLIKFNIKELEPTSNYLVYVSKVKETLTKYNKKMLFITLLVDGVFYDATCFDQYLFDKLQTNKFVILNFKLDSNIKLRISNVVSILD